MPDSPANKFLTHRFITDAIGHLIASYAALGIVYVIDNTSHTPSSFSHLQAIALALALIFMDYVMAKYVGNVRKAGLISLAMASIAGYILFVVGMEVITIAGSGTNHVTQLVIGAIMLSPIFLIPALAVPLIIRLMAHPIIRHFRLRD